MKHYRFLPVLFAAAALCVAAASAFIAPVVALAVSAGVAIKRCVLDGFALFDRADESHPRLAVPLIQAKAFVLRLAKRARPVLTSSWRMCPST